MQNNRTSLGRRWTRVLGGVVSLFLLAPMPAWATLTFSPWFFFSTNPTIISAQANPAGDRITFTPFTAGSGDFFIAGASTATWDGSGNKNLVATFNNWGTLGNPRAGMVSFQVTYNSINLFTGTPQNVSGLSNQFSSPATALSPGSQFLTFQVHFLPGSSWGAPSSQVSLVFSNP